jgi:thiamine pyrophosphokinase
VRVVVFAGVPVRPTVGLRARLAGADRVLAADSGARSALACGLTPDLVVGDLDSIDARTLARLRRLRVPLEVFPTDKDATDSDLALRRAAAWGASAITLVGALGGPRLDHGLANVLLLARPEWAALRLTLLDNRTEMTLLRGGETWTWATAPREIVSLLPLGEAAGGVTTAGLRWPLTDATLPPGSTWGVSNEAVAATASVRLAAGHLLVARTLPPDQPDWPTPGAGMAS